MPETPNITVCVAAPPARTHGQGFTFLPFPEHWACRGGWSWSHVASGPKRLLTEATGGPPPFSSLAPQSHALGFGLMLFTHLPSCTYPCMIHPFTPPNTLMEQPLAPATVLAQRTERSS